MVAQDSDVTVPGVEKWALLVGVLPNLQQRGFKLQYPKSEQTKQTRQTRQSKRAVAEEDEEYTEGFSKSTSKRKLRTRANAGKSGKSPAPSPQDTERETSFTTYTNQCKYNYSTRSQTSKRHPNPRLPLHKLQIQHPSNRRLHHLPGKRTLRSLVSSHHFRFRGKCRCQMGNDGESFLVE